MEDKEEKREEDKVVKETRESRFPAGQKHMDTVGQTTDRMPPRKLQQI